MGFNCAAEKAKFDREWAKLRKEYANAGMSEKSIQKIYEYDWHCFCRNRAYERKMCIRDSGSILLCLTPSGNTQKSRRSLRLPVQP